MLQLIGGHAKSGAANMTITEGGGERIINSHARDLDGLNPIYKAPPARKAEHKDKVDNLDPDIRRLVILCLASNRELRPDLPDLFEEIERNVNTKTQESYAGYKYQANESDEALRRISQQLICDADTQGQ